MLTTRPRCCLVMMYTPAEAHLMELSVGVMSNYHWIDLILLLDTTKKKPGRWKTPKVYEFGYNWGSGFETQPEDGGFNEIAARNSLLDAAYNMGADWIICADADELFRLETGSLIDAVEKQGKSHIWFACYPIINPKQYVRVPDYLRYISAFGDKLHDPHVRAFRTQGTVRYMMNPHAISLGWNNRTTHCWLAINEGDRGAGTDEQLHLHARHMFVPKRGVLTISDEHIHQLAKPLPDEYVEAWKRQEGL